MKILLINNASLNSDKFKQQNNLLYEAAKNLHIELEIKRNIDIKYYYDNLGVHLEELDCDAILFYDKDITLAKLLEEKGYKVFNSAECIKNCDNKALTYKILADNKLPIPKTFIFPLLFFPNTENNLFIIEQIERELKYPFVAKKWFGSEGQQVFLINNKKEFIELLDREKQELLFQEYFVECFGSDIRINIVDKKVVASMHRSSKTDFRANLSNGGHAEKYEPTDVESQLALKASDALGCVFCGVDILQTKNGPIVCEVNSNAHLNNIYKVTGINIASEILNYICKKIN